MEEQLANFVYRVDGEEVFYPVWSELFSNPSIEIQRIIVERHINRRPAPLRLPLGHLAIVSPVMPPGCDPKECTYIQPLCVSI